MQDLFIEKPYIIDHEQIEYCNQGRPIEINDHFLFLKHKNIDLFVPNDNN